MKNLEVFEVVTTSVKCLKNIRKVLQTPNLLFLYNGNNLYFYDQSTENKELVIKDVQIVTNLEFLLFENKLWFGVVNGFYFYSLQTREIKFIRISNQYKTASWNPEQDNLLLIDEDGKISVCVINSDAGTFVVKSTEVIGDHPVVLGWGSQGTQFQGMTASKYEIARCESGINTDDPTIAWHESGKLYVVNCLSSGRRCFKVYSFPAVLLYEIVDCPGLQSPVTWRSARNMIFSPMTLGDDNFIVVYENNGLKRHIFVLEVNIRVITLKWSSCGGVLAVHQRDLDEDVINLYTMNNFKWYLKQSLKFGTHVITMDFSDEVKNMFILRVFTTSHILKYTFRKLYHACNRVMACCAVIEGSTLLLTNFLKGTFSPPLYTEKIMVENPINFMTFNSRLQSFLLIDSCYKAYFYSYSNDNIILVHSVNIGDFSIKIPLQLSHFVWYKEHILLCCHFGILCTINYSSSRSILIPVIVQEKQDEVLKTLMVSEDKLTLIKQTEKTITLDNCANVVSLPFLASHVNAACFPCNPCIYALTPNNIFYINKTEIANNVTSFLIHGQYLLLTTTDNRMYALDCSDLDKAIVGNLNKCYFHPIEEGAQLICGLLDQCEIVLQMPRGNVETVTCVMIAMRYLYDLLYTNDWTQAVIYLKQKKLAYDILVDLNSEIFFGHTNLCYEALYAFGVLDTFILLLKDYNTLASTYKSCNITPINVLPDKKKQICTALLKYMETLENPYSVKSIMLCHIACKTIDGAILYIKGLYSQIYKNPSFKQLAERGFQTLMSYVPNEDLYVNVLRCYDLEFALFSCRIFKMDPQVYETFFETLKNLGELELRFQINDHISFHAEAANYLMCMKNVDVDRVVQYMRTHTLYKQMYQNALKNKSHVIFISISLEYGKYLISCKHFAEAGCIYAKVAYWDDAYNCYKKVNMWEDALVMLKRRNLSEEEKAAEKLSIADELVKAKEILCASKLYEEYCNLPMFAIKVLSKYNYFKEAVRLAEKHNINTNFIYADVLQHCVHVIERIQSTIENFITHKARLMEVRKNKIMKFTSDFLYESKQQKNDFVADTESTVTSKYSKKTSGSNTTTMSQKKKRKEELKKQDLRHGGLYEDIALIRYLHNLITFSHSFAPEVRNLCLLLLDSPLEHHAEANYLHKILSKLYSHVNKSLLDIWPSVLYIEDAKTPEILGVNQNFKQLDSQYQKPPNEISTSWMLSILETDS